MAQDTGLGLPRLGGASAGPGAGGASAGPRFGGAESDDSLKVPTPLPPGGGTPDRMANLWMGGELVLLLSTPLISLPSVFENRRLVFRRVASVEWVGDLV